MPLLTTIIPTLNRSRMLVGTIQSVLAQTFADWEIHVYDDASEDETRRVVQAIARSESRIKYFCHPQRIGMMPNFAFGIGRVESPYFNILSDDDLVLPKFYSVGVHALQANAKAMAFIGLLILAGSDGRIFDVPAVNWKEGLCYPPMSFVNLTGGHTWTSMIFRREALKTVGTLDTSVGSPGDQDFELRIAARHPVIVDRSPCAIFRIHSGSGSARDPLPGLLAGIPRAIENVSGAIALAERERVIDSTAAGTMRRAMLAGFQGQVFRQALVAIRHKHTASVLRAAEFLAQYPQTQRRARLVQLMGSSAILSPLTYTSLSAARRILRVSRWRKYRSYKSMTVCAFQRAVSAAACER